MKFLLGVVAISALSGDVCLAQKPQIVMGTIRIYGNDSYPVTMRRLQPIDSPRARYPGFKPSTMVLRKGSIRREGVKPLPVDMVFERDVAVKMRDGITMYTDVFRPVGNGTVPGIIG
jgi:predicted acyl esterase